MSNLIEKAAHVWDKAGLAPIWKEESTVEHTSDKVKADTTHTQMDLIPASGSIQPTPGLGKTVRPIDIEQPVTDVSDAHDEQPPASVPADTPHFPELSLAHMEQTGRFSGDAAELRKALEDAGRVPKLKMVHDDGTPEHDPRDAQHTIGTLTDQLMERARRGL